MTTRPPPPYADLGPDRILDAVESQGWQCNGRFLALNSYENRVYQIGIEDHTPLVAKFYRPHRWSDEAILEEHAFTLELADNEIPVAMPIADDHGNTLFHHAGFRFALFPSVGGRHPELDRDEHLQWLGRYLGRIHAVGAAQRFLHRQRIEVERLGIDAYQYVLEHGFVPHELAPSYRSIAEDVIRCIETNFSLVSPVRHLRLHGDCHMGNILWTQSGPTFLDFDDCVTGPAIQDLWMLLSGDQPAMEKQLATIIEGYNQFFDFDPAELVLIESLRTLRMLHYSAWLARRWDDPAFPAAFPWFNTPRYWEDQILSLKEQLSALNEPTLRLY